MKVSSNKPEVFAPFSITLNVETEEEARSLYALFNKVNNVDLVGYTNAKLIKEEIGLKYYVNHGEIANGVGYSQYYMGG